MNERHQGIAIYWIAIEYGPDVVPEGTDIAGFLVEADQAVLIGDDPMCVLEGSYEELARFHRKLGTALRRTRPRRWRKGHSVSRLWAGS